MSDLKPCPFCGGEAKYRDVTSGVVGDGEWHWAGCDNSMCKEADDLWKTKEEAIKAWNTRANTETLIAELEGLKKDTSMIGVLVSNGDTDLVTEIETHNAALDSAIKKVREHDTE